jgi:hypothetical protein
VTDEELLKGVTAYDAKDGDISDRVIITATDYNTNEVGVFNVSLVATNSMGGTIYMEVPVYIKDLSFYAPKIELTEHLVHLFLTLLLLQVLLTQQFL